MRHFSVVFVALALLAPTVTADIISDVCGKALKGSFCARNGTSLVSCAARTQTTCGVNEFCQVQGASLARCEPISRDAGDVCKAVQADGLSSAIRCSSEVPNVRISCPNALISKCPSGKVCVQSNSRYARCELPTYTSEYIVVETFAADMDAVSVSNTIPVTLTTSLALTTTVGVLETIFTTPAATVSILPDGSNTDAGFPVTMVDMTTMHIPGFATVLESTTLVHIVPTTYVSVEFATAVETVVATRAPVLTTVPVRTLSETVMRTHSTVQSTHVAVITAIETIDLSTTIASYPTIETTPLATLTETVVQTPIFTILPWTDLPLTESFTISTTVDVPTNLPTTLPDWTMTVSHTEQVLPTWTATQLLTEPIVTMTATANMPTIALSTQTAVYPEIVIVPSTSVYTMTALDQTIVVLPTTDVTMWTALATATPLITISNTQSITFTPIVTDVLPTSAVLTSIWASAVPGTKVSTETTMATDVATVTDVSTAVAMATTTVHSPTTTLIPTIATDTFIVCSTPTPTVVHNVPEYYSMAVTESPMHAATQVIGTRTRGPNTVRTQTSVLAGMPTMLNGHDESIAMTGLFSQHAQLTQPAMIKVQGECTTSYRVKFGYATTAAVATHVRSFPVTSSLTSVARVTAVATNVALATDIVTASMLPMHVPYTSELGVFTTAYPAQPTHTLDVVDVLVPTLVAFTREPVPVTETGFFTTTLPLTNAYLATHVAHHAIEVPVTAVEVSTVYPALPTSTVLVPLEPLTTALVTEVPTVTATVPAETTLQAMVTSTVQLPPVPVSVISTYISKYTKVHVDVDVETATSGVAAPTVVSTINVYPSVVQVTVTARETSAHAAATLIKTTQVATQVVVAATPTLTVETPPTTLVATQHVTQVVSAPSTMTQETLPAQVTRVISLATNVHTTMATSALTETLVSTRTFDAVPTGHLVIRAHPSPRLTVTSVQTATTSVTQPHAIHINTARSAVPRASVSMVTVTSTAAVTNTPTTSIGPATMAKPTQMTTKGPKSAVATRTGTVSVPTPTPMPKPAPIEPVPMSTTCPPFAIGAAQYKLTAPGSAASGEASCAALGAGWSLANIVDNYEFFMVGDNVCSPSYYQSWADDSYDGACLAMYPGGATAVPAQGCHGKLASLCKFVAA